MKLNDKSSFSDFFTSKLSDKIEFSRYNRYVLDLIPLQFLQIHYPLQGRAVLQCSEYTVLRFQSKVPSFLGQGLSEVHMMVKLPIIFWSKFWCWDVRIDGPADYIFHNFDATQCHNCHSMVALLPLHSTVDQQVSGLELTNTHWVITYNKQRTCTMFI